MHKLKKIGKVFTSKFVGTGPSSYEKRIYRAAVSQKLRNTALEHLVYSSCDIYMIYKRSYFHRFYTKWSGLPQSPWKLRAGIT